jgi:hypothetical protein
MKDAAITVRVETDLKAAVEKAAANDNRSVAGLFEKLLKEFLKKQGLLKR